MSGLIFTPRIWIRIQMELDLDPDPRYNLCGSETQCFEDTRLKGLWDTTIENFAAKAEPRVLVYQMPKDGEI